jgi:hypothetical protein
VDRITWETIAGSALDARGNIASRLNQDVSGKPHNPLVWATAGRRGEVRSNEFRLVDSDYREIACAEFEDVWATTTAGGLLSSCMWVWSESSRYHARGDINAFIWHVNAKVPVLLQIGVRRE